MVRMGLNALLGIIIIQFLFSCAPRYQMMRPDKKEFYNRIENDKLTVAYNPEILEITKNYKQYKKAKRKKLIFAAAEFVNHSDDTLKLSEDIKFTSQNNEIRLLTVNESYELLKQHPASYYLTLLSMGIAIGSEGTVAYFGLNPVALIYAIPNSIIASKSNAKMKAEFNKFDFYNIDLLPSDTAYAFLCYNGTTKNDLSILSINGDSLRTVISSSPNKSFAIDSVLYYNAKQGADFNLYMHELVEVLKLHKLVLEVKEYKETYNNGNLKYAGIKAKHQYGNNSDYYYKIGTWKYFYKNGQLKEYIDYNLYGEKNGAFKFYNENGILEIEKRYFHNRDIYCNDCIMLYDKDNKNDIIELKNGKSFECKILNSNPESLNLKVNGVYTTIDKEKIYKIVYGKH